MLTKGKLSLNLIFDALGDNTRFQIFKLLLEDKGYCVSEIAIKLGISVSAVSQHFRVLEGSGLVASKRSGQMICYEIKKSDPTVRSIIKMIK